MVDIIKAPFDVFLRLGELYEATLLPVFILSLPLFAICVIYAIMRF